MRLTLRCRCVYINCALSNAFARSNARGKRSCLLDEFIGERGRKFSYALAAGVRLLIAAGLITARRGGGPFYDVWRTCHRRKPRLGCACTTMTRGWVELGNGRRDVDVRASRQSLQTGSKGSIRRGDSPGSASSRPPPPLHVCRRDNDFNRRVYRYLSDTADTRLTFYLFDAYPIMLNYSF